MYEIWLMNELISNILRMLRHNVAEMSVAFDKHTHMYTDLGMFDSS